MKRILLAVAILPLLVLAMGAAGGSTKPAQDEPEFPPPPQEFTLSVGDEIRLGKGLTLWVVRHQGVTGAYFSGKNTSVFYADGKWVLDVSFPEGFGKVFVGQGGDRIFLEGSATRCRVNSSRGGALCTGARSAFPPYPCMLMVTGKKLSFIRFTPLDPEDLDKEAFERCAS